VVTGFGLGFEVLAIWLTPTLLQDHVKRSRFGIGDGHFGPRKDGHYDSCYAEFAALEELIHPKKKKGEE
jgi:hypothetical protein